MLSKRAAWVVSGVAANAIGTVVGVRLLTSVLSPEEFGSLSLLLGLVAIILGTLFNPLAQAVMHAYPTCLAEGDERSLHGAHSARLRHVLVICIPFAFLSFSVGLFTGERTAILAGCIASLALLEAWRSLNLSVLGTLQMVRPYAIWITGDAWLRPIFAALAVYLLHGGPLTALIVQLLIGTVLYAAFSHPVWRFPSWTKDHTEIRLTEQARNLWTYAVPLIPLGLMSWMSNLGDRYIIGAMIDLRSAGIYAAVYGLSSAPFMMAAGTLELLYRPQHQTAVSTGDFAAANAIEVRWTASISFVCAIGFLMFVALHSRLVQLLTGPEYWQGASLAPWIAAGYAIRAVTATMERRFYAHGATRKVLLLESVGLVTAAIAAPIGILGWGLHGAAAAVPLSFLTQFILAATLLRNQLPRRSDAKTTT